MVCRGCGKEVPKWGHGCGDTEEVRGLRASLAQAEAKLAGATEYKGVALGITGYEEDYLLLIGNDGQETSLGASALVPQDGRICWPLFEALTGGFDEEMNADVLSREGPLRSRAYRIRITVETEPLSEAETVAALESVKRKRAEPSS